MAKYLQSILYTDFVKISRKNLATTFLYVVAFNLLIIDLDIL